MATFDISKFIIYRWRYILGYGLVGLALAGLLIFAGLFLPGGVSATEMKSVVTSDSLSLVHFASYARLNLPYSILQSLSFDFFGVHDFSIKLPSLVLAFASGLGLIFLLRRWFSRNIAILGSFIAVTTGQFLFIAQNGTPGILYIFWPVMLLLLGTLVIRAHKLQFLWKILFFVTAALSLYTPLSIYPLLAMFLATFLHPHLRNVVRNLSKPKLIGATVLGLIILSPLLYGIVIQPSFALSLLGVPTQTPDLFLNIKSLAQQYFYFWKPSSTTLMTPVFGLGSAFLIVLGLYRLIRTRDTTQSYLVIFWLICLVPVLIVSPTFSTVTFVPLVLLLTTGFAGLINYWYRLFPRNPYARIAGFIPLTILVVALVATGLDRYAYGYYYQPETNSNFSRDLSLLPANTANLVVTTDEQSFYNVVARHYKGLIVTTQPQTGVRTFTTTQAAHGSFNGYAINRIVTSDTTQGGDRFYTYESTP